MAQDRPPVAIRSKGDQIARLRKRLRRAEDEGADTKLVDIFKGILDLLDDQL